MINKGVLLFENRSDTKHVQNNINMCTVGNVNFTCMVVGERGNSCKYYTTHKSCN